MYLQRFVFAPVPISVSHLSVPSQYTVHPKSHFIVFVFAFENPQRGLAQAMLHNPFYSLYQSLPLENPSQWHLT